MEITRRKVDSELEIKLCGRLDASWSDLVNSTLAESMRGGEHRIALEMSEVNYLSSAGIRVLMQAYKQLRGINGTFRIVSPSSAVRSTIELSGLGMLLVAPQPAKDAAAKEQRTDAARREIAGVSLEVHEADKSIVEVHVLGDPDRAARGVASPSEGSVLSIDDNIIAVGLGALGDAHEDLSRLGEFLAAGGAACFLPGDGSNETDYLLRQGDFLPAARIAHGLVGRGCMQSQFRFDEELPLSAIAEAALQLAGGEASAITIIAETAYLVGAAVKQAGMSNPLSFPAIKDAMSFTAEPAHRDTVSLAAGFISRSPEPLQLRPMQPQRALFGHIHAAAFSYAPLRKGRLELTASVRGLFENQAPRGVLHLINDWRECSGIGESRFVRGVCWYSAITVKG